MVGHHIHLYRPQRVMGVSPDGFLQYEPGDLRAKLFGVRVPIQWALDKLVEARQLMFQARQEFSADGKSYCVDIKAPD